MLHDQRIHGAELACKPVLYPEMLDCHSRKECVLEADFASVPGLDPEVPTATILLQDIAFEVVGLISILRTAQTRMEKFESYATLTAASRAATACLGLRLACSACCLDCHTHVARLCPLLLGDPYLPRPRWFQKL